MNHPAHNLARSAPDTRPCLGPRIAQSSALLAATARDSNWPRESGSFAPSKRFTRTPSNEPVLDGQPRNPFEMPHVVCHKCRPVRHCGRRDQRVRLACWTT